jgi:hypothetical protein
MSGYQDIKNSVPTPWRLNAAVVLSLKPHFPAYFGLAHYLTIPSISMYRLGTVGSGRDSIAGCSIVDIRSTDSGGCSGIVGPTGKKKENTRRIVHTYCTE